MHTPETRILRLLPDRTRGAKVVESRGDAERDPNIDPYAKGRGRETGSNRSSCDAEAWLSRSSTTTSTSWKSTPRNSGASMPQSWNKLQLQGRCRQVPECSPSQRASRTSSMSIVKRMRGSIPLYGDRFVMSRTFVVGRTRHVMSNQEPPISNLSVASHCTLHIRR